MDKPTLVSRPWNPFLAICFIYLTQYVLLYCALKNSLKSLLESATYIDESTQIFVLIVSSVDTSFRVSSLVCLIMVLQYFIRELVSSFFFIFLILSLHHIHVLLISIEISLFICLDRHLLITVESLRSNSTIWFTSLNSLKSTNYISDSYSSWRRYGWNKFILRFFIIKLCWFVVKLFGRSTID